VKIARGKLKIGGKYFKGVVCPVKMKGGVLICNLIITFPYFGFRPSKKLFLFFTGRKLRPPSIGIEATRWSPKKYVLDNSLNVTKIRGRGRVGVRNEKVWLPYMSCPPYWPPHKKLAPPLFTG